MRLIDALPIEKTSRLAFVGAGGKTTAMFRLARQAQIMGMNPIFCSATTHLAEEQLALADQHFVIRTPEDIISLYDVSMRGITLLTGELGEDHRTRGLSLALMDQVNQLADYHQAALLVEADGARRKPLKAPADHEPVIPAWVLRVVVVAGMSGMEKALGEECIHHPEIFGELSGLKPGERISADALVKVLLSEFGGLKNIPAGARRVMLLNQCDTPEKAAQAKALSERLITGYGQVILSNLNDVTSEDVFAVHRRVAGVILAAGGSIRMGQPKQLLHWKGKSFIQAVAKTALDSGLNPVVVISGAYQDQVKGELKGYPVDILHNPDWAEGQASSVRRAVESISPEAQDLYGVIFFLVDQPQIPVALVKSLLDSYYVSLTPIIAPLINDRRGNPVLFDQITFEELAKLTGDAGGRQVFSRFQVQYVPWLDDRAGLDVDTFADYQRLLREE